MSKKMFNHLPEAARGIPPSFAELMLKTARGAERKQQEEVDRRKRAVVAAQKELEVHTKLLTELAKVTEGARLTCKAEVDKKEAEKKEADDKKKADDKKEADKKEAKKKEAEKKEAEKRKEAEQHVKKEEELEIICLDSDTESDTENVLNVVPRKVVPPIAAGGSAANEDVVFGQVVPPIAAGGSAVQQAIPVDNNNQPPIQKGRGLRALSEKDAGGAPAPNIFTGPPDPTSAQVVAAADLLKRFKAAIDGMDTFLSGIMIRDMIACRTDEKFQQIRTKILDGGMDLDFWPHFLNGHFLTLASICDIEKGWMYQCVNEAMLKNFPEEMKKFLEARAANNAKTALSRKRKSDWPPL
jgi:hypothetical protein